ncbi:helicase, partial [Tanacetum coccineum]
NNHADRSSLSNILHTSVMIHLNTIIRRDGTMQSFCGLKLLDIGKKWAAKKARKPAALSSTGTEVSSYWCSNLPMLRLQYNHVGLYTFRINEQNYHRIGLLLPKEGTQPRDWCHSHTSVNVELRLLSERTNSRQYNAPTIVEVVALITNDFGDDEPTRDIVVNKKDNGLKRISELHTSYMHSNILCYSHMEKMGIMIRFHLFVTFTSNPKCPQIYEMLAYIPGQRAHDRPEVGTRFFKLKLTELLNDLTKNQVFGESHAVVYVIEFQKCGLPHTHVLLWLEEHDKCKTLGDTDNIISAELPSPTDDPAGYKAITDYMLHEPCRKGVACNVEGKCLKHFPKTFCTETIIDQDGYPIYRQRDNKVCVKKGPDRATIVIEENVPNGQGVTPKKVTVVDEINNYLNCRYLAPCEAVWHIFLFDIHYAYPFVMKLNFHLSNQHPVTLRDSKCLPALLEREGINVIMLNDWFNLNERHLPAKTLTYAKILEHYVWHEQSKMWKPQK